MRSSIFMNVALPRTLEDKLEEKWLHKTMYVFRFADEQHHVTFGHYF